MIIANIVCERGPGQKQCMLYDMKKKGTKHPKSLLNNACMSCPSGKVVITSAGWTRANKGIDHLVNAATTLEAFEYDGTDISSESEEV